MAERTASIPYNGTPTVQAGGGGGTMFGVRASPNDFGAQTGAAMQDLGKEFARFDGMINETVANTAEIDYMKASGELTSKYQSLKGLAAQAAFPQYQKDLLELRQKLTKDMPVKASNAFNSVVQRQEISLLNSGREYGLKQVQAANVDSNNALSQLAISQTADPAVAADDMAFGERMGTIRYSVDAMMDAQGYSAHASRDEAGNLVFNDTPEGQKGKAVYQAELEQRIAMAWENRLKTVANTNVMTAYKMLQDNRKDIPGPVQVQMDAWFQPKVADYKISENTKMLAGEASHGYQDTVLNPNNTVGIIMQNELAEGGKVTVHDDGDGQAIGGINSEAYPAQFAEAKRILETDGQAAAKSYISKFYQSEIVDKNGISSLPKGVQAIVADGLTNHWGGFQKDLLAAAQRGASAQELLDMRRKEYQRLATENPEKYGKYLEGWNNRLNKFIPTEGILPTDADYLAANKESIIQRQREWAEKEFPNNPSYQESAVNNMQQYLNTKISEQKEMKEYYSNMGYKAINGTLSNGKLPKSMAEMRAISPDVAKTMDWLQENNPKLYGTFQKALTKNSKSDGTSGSDKGEAFGDLWKRATQLKKSDPDYPQLSEILDSYGDGKLTEKGMDRIKDAINGKYEKESPYANEALKWMENKIILSSPITANKTYLKATIAQAENAMLDALHDGLTGDKPLTIQQLTDPESPDFIGLAAKKFLPSDTDTAVSVLTAPATPAVRYGIPLPFTDLKIPFAYGLFDKPEEKPVFENRFAKAVEDNVINEDNGYDTLMKLRDSGLINDKQAMDMARKYKYKYKRETFKLEEPSAPTMPDISINMEE